MANWNLDYNYLNTLVERAQNGDSDAFAELYLATYKNVHRFAYRYLRNEGDAEDAVQETYVIVFQKLRTLKDPRVFISWLNQIAFRVCFAVSKKRAKNREISVSELSVDLTSMEANAAQQPENIMIRIDEKNFIIQKIMGLPFSESQVIILRYYNGMKIEEIAEMLEISRSSVKRYLASGREKLGLLIER